MVFALLFHKNKVLRQTKSMYYNYHQIIKNKIKAGLLSHYEYLESYHNIRPALVLYFKDHTQYPIREYRWHEYYKYLKDL